MKVQLAKEYVQGMEGSRKDTTPYKTPPLGWLMSEKFDGYRALFCYEEGIGTFYSRNGKKFNAPEWFLQAMPPPNLLKDMILDGELWAGRENFQMMGTVRKKVPVPEEWTSIKYQVYDITNIDASFIDRLRILKTIVQGSERCWSLKCKKKRIEYPFHNIEIPLIYAKQTVVQSNEGLSEYYQAIIREGGEGIMLKHPQMPYEDGRSSSMLKYKPVFDREAIIIDYKKGDGKYKGKLGAFVCRPLLNRDQYMIIDKDDSHIFTLSGMDDNIRTHYKKTHPLQTIISYECSGYTDKGKPRFGRYLRKREDIIIKECDDSSNTSLLLVRKIFRELEEYAKANQESFRYKSYRSINQALSTLSKDEELIDGTLQSIKGVGQGTRDKIREILESGTCASYEKIKSTKDSPKEEFLKMYGIGVRKASELVKEGFKSVDDLRKRGLHLLNDVQRAGLDYYEDMLERIPYAEIVEHERFLKECLHSIDPEADLTIAGSYRRKKADSGDIDVLVKADHRKICDQFIKLLVSQGYLICELANGKKKYMGISRLHKDMIGRRIDIMYTTPDQYPFAILYFTGSSEFNQKMRADILERGMTLNEYSLKDSETMEPVNHIFRKEKDIFEYLNYDYIVPEKR